MPGPVRSLLTSLAVTILCACASVSAQEQPTQSITAFFALPLQQQHEEFRTFPLDKQFEIFIYSMQRRHPADLSFAYDMTSKGQAAATFLAGKLEVTKDEWTQEIIVYAFEVMAKQKYYAVASDGQLVARLKHVVASMKRPANRENSERSLKAILE